MLSLWYTLENHTLLAQPDGEPLGGMGLRYNLGSKEVTQSGFPYQHCENEIHGRDAQLLKCKEILEETNVIKTQELILLHGRAPKHRFGKNTSQTPSLIHLFQWPCSTLWIILGNSSRQVSHFPHILISIPESHKWKFLSYACFYVCTISKEESWKREYLVIIIWLCLSPPPPPTHS